MEQKADFRRGALRMRVGARREILTLSRGFVSMTLVPGPRRAPAAPPPPPEPQHYTNVLTNGVNWTRGT